MFLFFAENRANYNKGQVFPFIIAIIVVIIIMAMITANLGKLAIFKTDVSNAADAGALGSVSVLSNFLLGLGLESDTWCANGIVLIARMAQIFIQGRDDIHVPGISLSQLLGSGSSGSETGTGEGETGGDEDSSSSGDLRRYPQDLIAAVKLYVPYVIGFQFSLQKAKMNSKMTWSSAKQKALSDAFGNVGVDEGLDPRKKFKYHSSMGYNAYLNTYLSREANQTGFSRFMSHPITGFSKAIGPITPGRSSPFLVLSGYGWSQREDESFTNSYDKRSIYLLEDNYVEVLVSGSSDYPITKLTWTQFGMIPYFSAVVVYWGAYSKYVRNNQCPTWVGKILCLAYAATVAGFYTEAISTLPIGYTFTGRNMKQYTDRRPISLRVTRYKKGNDMGMWNFQYGRVAANSSGHAFVVNRSTIEPALLNRMQGPFGSPDNWFDTSAHLFETELTGLVN
jgi:hypothetical protein